MKPLRTVGLFKAERGPKQLMSVAGRNNGSVASPPLLHGSWAPSDDGARMIRAPGAPSDRYVWDATKRSSQWMV